jgi:hypothetical protein
MAKYELRIKAREMRRRGESVKQIAKVLGVAKSTASLWVRDIILSLDQYQNLKKRQIKGGEKGRFLGSMMQKNRRIEKMRKMEEIGIDKFRNISDNEFFAAGVALYWGEGSKKKREFYICNSDPELLSFMISWLEKFCDIGRDRLRAVVGINETHKKREEVVKKYWSDKLGIPLSQFRKTSFKKAKVNKVYENFNDHFGTLGIRVLKGGEIYYKILGLIAGLSKAKLY